ncbi:5993_t:CDS:2 [Paraglomus occultum]|uniref:5993_t:CDS:1 n=1 Tax=Paraglomus occultum TaxID=144539 RepID=A0A9N9D449_9GLOM|nr:5993_t:CDS:2 [Paraglomus occultum]
MSQISISSSIQENDDNSKKFDIAISDDGKEVVKFNADIQLLETFKVSSSQRVGPQFEPTGFSHNVKSDAKRWSIAISNAVNGFTIVALSLIVDKNEQEVLHNNKEVEDMEKNLPDFSSTRVFIVGDSKNTGEEKASSTKNTRIATSVDYVAGVVNFTLCPDSNWLLTVLNEEGLFQHKINPNKVDDFSKSSPASIPFAYKLSKKSIKKDEAHYLLRTDEENFQLSARNIKSHLYFETGAKDAVHAYDLKDGKHILEFSNHRNPSLFGHETPIYAISSNRVLLAACLDNASVAIYLLENSLECGKKDLKDLDPKETQRVMLIEFINNDEQLLILKEDRETYDVEATIWELFTCRPVRNVKINELNKFFQKSIFYSTTCAEKESLNARDETVLERSGVYEWDDSAKLLKFLEKSGHNWRVNTEKCTSSYTEEVIVKNHTSGYSTNKPRIAIDGEKFHFKGTDYLEIRWPLDPCKVVTDACQALNERVDEDSKQKEGNYVKRYKLKHQLTDIVRRFIRQHPNEWRLLEVRYELMQCLLRGGCSRLVKDLVAVSGEHSDERGKDEQNLHIPLYFPREHTTDKDGNPKEKDSDLSIPLHFPREHTWETDKDGNPKEKDSDLMITMEEKPKLTDNFLTYYAHLSNEHFGWLCTARKALTRLSEKEHLVMLKNRFFAHPTFMGRPTSQHKIPLRTHSNIFGSFPKLTDDLEELKKKLVIKKIEQVSQVRKDWKFIHDIINFQNLLRLIFMPLLVWEIIEFVWHGIYRMRNPERGPEKYVKVLHRVPMPCDEKVAELLKQAVDDENSEITFDNPAIAGLVNSAWAATSFYYQSYMFFHIYFLVLFGTYIFRFDDTDKQREIAHITYIIGIGLVIVQLYAIRRLRSFYDMVKISCNLIMYISTIVLTIILETKKNYLGNTVLHALIAAATFMLWFKLLMLLKPYEGAGIYVFIVISIFEHLTWFLISLFIILFAVGHTMYVFLHNPSDVKLAPNALIFGVNLTTPDGDVATNYTVYQKLNEKDVSDNNFASFWNSVISTYGWTNGRWDGLDWDYYPLKLFVIASSLLLVIVMLNILIAIIGDVYNAAKINGRREIVRARAAFLVNYGRTGLNTIRKRNSHYIYVFGNDFQFKNWVKEKQEFRESTDPLVNRFNGNNSLPVLFRMLKKLRSIVSEKFRRNAKLN